MNEPLHTQLFIPEQYLKHKEFLVELPGHGWGIFIEAKDLGPSITTGRVAAQVLPANFIGVLQETAVSPDK